MRGLVSSDNTNICLREEEDFVLAKMRLLSFVATL